MFYHEQRNCYPENIKWNIRLNFTFIKSKKPEDFSTVIEYRWSSKYRGNFLDTVEFAKSDEMIIVSMRPDHGIDMRGAMQEKLLPKIR